MNTVYILCGYSDDVNDDGKACIEASDMVIVFWICLYLFAIMKTQLLICRQIFNLPLGYDGIFAPKPASACLEVHENSDGCALFFKRSKVKVISTEVSCCLNG